MKGGVTARRSKLVTREHVVHDLNLASRSRFARAAANHERGGLACLDPTWRESGRAASCHVGGGEDVYGAGMCILVCGNPRCWKGHVVVLVLASINLVMLGARDIICQSAQDPSA